MLTLSQQYNLLEGEPAEQVLMDYPKKIMVYERKGLIFVCNLHPSLSVTHYKIPIYHAGDYRIILNTDAVEFGGAGLVDTSIVYQPSGGKYRKTLNLYIPCRTTLVLSLD